MKYRTLGRDLKVSALGLGCMPMSGFRGSEGVYGAVDEGEAIATIHRAIDLGVTFFDTAEIYGPYVNEELLGRSIKGRREGLVIATKFVFGIEGGVLGGLDGSPANARRACEGSLKRLGVEAIDLFYLHRVDPNTPIEETVGGMADLVKEGKIRHIGLSEAGPTTIRRAHAVHPVTALQSEYSLWERDVETDILPVTRELGIGFVPYSPLGRGFLTGAFSSRDSFAEGDYRKSADPRLQGSNIDANLRIVEAVRQVGTRHGVSPARVALAWLLAQGNDIVPIPGAKRRVTMEDSMAAADLELTADDLASLNAAAPIGGTAGPRYGAEQMKTVKI
jgi:aryl-alcohol dehydrogenase-like predicted oxidoreductase